MIIREIQEQDNQRLEFIIKKSLESVGLNQSGTAYYDPQLSHLTQHYKSIDKAQYWVIVDDGDTVVGGAGIGPFDVYQGICELQKLYLDPKVQGRGLSKDLLNVALAFAKEHYQYCYIETSSVLYVANNLYSRLGFERLDKPLVGSEHNAMDIWYLKKLV